MPDRLVTGLLAISVQDFFRAYGVACELVESHEPLAPDDVLGSMIGFRGKTLRGGLAIVAPRELILAMLPVPIDPAHTDAQVRDWGAEIANQLFGRLKNLLGSRSKDLDVGMPSSFLATAIDFSLRPTGDSVSLRFRAGEAVVQIHLDCGGLRPPDVATDEHLAEGDSLLF